MYFAQNKRLLYNEESQVEQVRRSEMASLSRWREFGLRMKPAQLHMEKFRARGK
jgi:hypothetical protein